MHVDDIAKAAELHAELKLWREARKRCDQGVFKHARLSVADMAHGHQNQVAETTLQIKREEISSFADAQVARLCQELNDLGIET